MFELTEQHLKLLRKSGEKHKHVYGHGLVVSGPLGQGGAARLAARGALRIGAGLVSVICEDNALVEHASNLTSIMVKPFDRLDEFSQRLGSLKADAICIGPNLGLDSVARAKLDAVLGLDVPVCLDADAITLLAKTPRELVPHINENSILTPHEGELKRLIPSICEQTTCRVTRARQAAKKLGCSVLYKGSDTLIAKPDGQYEVVSSQGISHAPWLATAGSGDVLAGFITGLLAKKIPAFEAAAIAARLHLLCAQHIGPGLIAEDLPEAIPPVFQTLFREKPLT